MGIKPDLFAQGALPTSQQLLYKPSSTQSASVKVTLVNTSTSVAKVRIYLKQGSGTARLITPKDLQIPKYGSFTTCYEEIGGGDSLEGYSLGGVVDYTINGILKS